MSIFFTYKVQQADKRVIICNNPLKLIIAISLLYDNIDDEQR